ncbi:MAG: PDZ domain-containing protein [Oscillochloris sp.]|nr:PDZ domain-containing protein [Oscillochloris sp.]
MSEQIEAGKLLQTLSFQMADAVEQAAAAMVQVRGRPRQPASGIALGGEHILTADHVLEREEDLAIETPDGQVLPAQVVGRDPASDLALLQVPGLTLAALAAADSAARVGQLILAVGRPLSGGPMASLGIVSAVGGPLRSRRGATLEQFIQTDATPYPGFSGGPLIDGAGHALGILSTGLAGGVALAVPIGLAQRVADTLARHGYVRRGFLGISSQPVVIPDEQRASVAQERGLLVVRVEPGTPAAAGGLILGDVLLSFAGNTLHDTDDLQALLAGELVGKPAEMKILRGGVAHTLQITVGERR